MNYRILLFVLLTCSAEAWSQKVSLNNQWQFSKEDTLNWQKVNLPHTWNEHDPFDDEKGYFRGDGWYKKYVHIPDEWTQKHFFLHFEAANQIATVFWNGKKIGHHVGGYTAFNVPIPEVKTGSKNELLVKVNNAHNEDVIPLKGDFNFYGGIYRDVWLIVKNPTHFELDSLGTFGLKITPLLHQDKGTVHIKTNIINQNPSNTRFTIGYEVLTPEGNVVVSKTQKIRLKERLVPANYNLTIDQPLLWSPKQPDLYQLVVKLRNKEGELVDVVEDHFGFRSFRFDADSGFYINGKAVKLIGANRHQDFPEKGNALDNARHYQDLQLLKDMGANFFRTAHYPQDQAVLDACDELGLVVTMEIPLDHDITDSQGFYRNSRNMMSEMIAQYYNHPSVVIWAYMNEMFLGRQLPRDQKKIEQIVHFAKELEQLTRSSDSTRYTMIPNHGDFEVYFNSGITDIPMIVGWNLYYGWYEEGFEGFSEYLRNAHARLPEKPMIITEYGAGADPRIFSNDPERFDFSVDWETAFHNAHYRQIMELPFLAGAAVWNLFDFGSENRSDAVPKINSKGLMTFDRNAKDAYWLYKGYLTETPFLKILGEARKKYPVNTDLAIDIITNADSVNLIINGKPLSYKVPDENRVSWKIKTPEAKELIIIAEAYHNGELTVDTRKIELIDDRLSANTGYFAINVGSPFYFFDDKQHTLWRADQAYQNANGWGYIDGEMYRPLKRGVGSNRNINNTKNDPVYQTQLNNLTAYRINCTKGRYAVILHLSRLSENQKVDKTKYSVNGKEIEILEPLMLFEPYQSYIEIEAEDRILIELSEPGFLNGIEVIKK
ncbi:MAG TPA: glycoside hydrolase family 2 [Cytophagales bacterium]|jgi:beta-galactosidase|nr:glycoside hydrolase family 2 [Cytophagales bacterium]